MAVPKDSLSRERNARYEHHAPFAIVYVGLVEDPKHAEAMGLPGLRMFLRILAIPGALTGEVRFSMRTLARWLQMDHREAQRYFRHKLLGKYVFDTGRKVGHDTVYRIHRPFDDAFGDPDAPPSEVAQSGDHTSPVYAVESGDHTSPDGAEVATARRRFSGAKVATSHHATGDHTSPEVATNGRHHKIERSKTAAARAQARTREAAAAVAAAGPDPEAAPAATTEPPACPVPEDLLEEWAEWAYPTAPDPLGELRGGGATMRRLAELWDRVPRPSAWRAAMRAKPRSEVKVPIALFPRLLDQCAGEGDSTRSDATRSESERLRQASLDARRERLAEIAGWIWTRGARLDRRQAERLGIGDLAISDDGTQAAVLGWVEPRGLEVVTTSGPRILAVAELAHWCAADAARTGAPEPQIDPPTMQPRSRLGSAGAAWLQRRNGAPDRRASSDGAGSTIDPGAEMARALERELA